MDANNVDYVTYAGAEELTGLRRRDLQRLVAAKRIPYLRLGPRTVRFDTYQLREWLHSRLNQD